MGKPLHVLLVEDSPTDAELILHELARGGYDVTFERVQTAEDMRAALGRRRWQLVLSDYSMPTFSGPEALAVLQESTRDLPFIMMSGSVGEDTAVAAMKAGASDFVVKHNLTRLIPALERELREAALREKRAEEHAALEQQLRQAQKMEAVGQLAGGVAHDFNNILTAIIGYAAMVLEQIGPDKPISADLVEIQKAAERAASLTRQLLAFSRRQTLDMKVLDLNDVLGSMRDMLERLIREDIKICLDLAPALPPILGDRIQLEQVVLNLVVNARDAMPRGGLITIETASVSGELFTDLKAQDARPRASVRLSVRDTGIGMDEATQARIFEPFFTTKPTGEGTGLGLATVYGVVQQLGGHIAFSSEVGQGTRFVLHFPETAAAPTVNAPAEPSAALVADDRATVLVVEDLRAVRVLVSRMLTRHGYHVLEADGPVAALALVENGAETVDLIVSDVVMPHMSGPEMIERLRKKRPNLKVLYISGYSNRELAKRGDLGRNAAILEKPFTPAVLLKAVRQILQRQRVSLVESSGQAGEAMRESGRNVKDW
jgi:signal transduction histidine kinase